MQTEIDMKQKIEEYADLVYRVALTRCESIENAEDVFQDVFLRLSMKNPKFESKEHEKAWLIRVTINLTKNVRNMAWNRKVVSLDENMIFETKEENDVFEKVCELSKNYRTVIYLFYYEGYKVDEISRLMNKSSGTIKTWLYRAREELRKKLEGGFDNG